MLIKFHKGRGEPDTLVCVRSDDSVTGMRPDHGPPAVHDLFHFAVETVLGLRDSFYGLVARGMNIEDFNVSGATKALDLPVEAAHTEFIVGLLQMEQINGSPYEDFNAEIREQLAQRGEEPQAEIPAAALERIRAEIARLVHAWRTLAPGETMELEYPEAAPVRAGGDTRRKRKRR